jgi:HAUS augmin-like complex subunit 3
MGFKFFASVIPSDAQAGLSIYVSAPGIVQQISALHADLMTLQSDLENSLPEDRNRCIIEL